MTADDVVGQPLNLAGPLVGVCSTFGNTLLSNLLVLALVSVDDGFLVEEGMREMLDGGMSSNSSKGADVFG